MMDEKFLNDFIDGLKGVKNIIIKAFITWIIAGIMAMVVFYFNVRAFQKDQEKINEETKKEMAEIKDMLKDKITQKDLENYTKKTDIQLNSISSAVDNVSRQQDNTFNYLLNKHK